MSSNSNPLVVDNSFLPYKPQPQPYKKYTKYNCFYTLAFFCSLLLFLFLSIFIIFKNQLSFSSLFNSTIFWFFIANALIFIIAADHYGFFSLSQHQSLDLYEEDYYSPPNNSKLTPFQLQSPSFVVFEEDRDNPDQKLQIVVQGSDFPPPLKTPPARTSRRNKSEKQPKRTVSNTKESQKMAARRSESVKHEGKELEENEFSKMTDEELNRRVEEFIQRSNRQMRLQTRSTELNSLVF